MTWDPSATLAKTLWIGGGQWAGKSTASNLLADRYGITAYHHDYHSARSHWDRQVAAAGGTLTPPTAQGMYVDRSPRDSADNAIAHLENDFAYILDDLRALHTARPIIAEGWALRPKLVAPLVPSLDQIVVVVPTDEFRVYQSLHLDRAKVVPSNVTDPESAQRNRMERDRLVALDAIAQANELGIRVIMIDGSNGAEATADLLADHFAAYLR